MCVRNPTKSRLNIPYKQIQPLSRKKTFSGPRVCGISPVGEEEVYGGKDLPESSLEFRMKD